jgi:ABC-type dipeptide/oligopeptide/nickel transport system permease component
VADHLLRRLGGMLTALLAFSLLTFMAVATIPGDAAQALAGESASAAQLATLRRQLGLDHSALARYGAFMTGLLLRGDMGRSLASGRPVASLVWERLPYTVALALAAITLAALFGGLAGTLAALRAGTLTDTLLMTGSALGLAVPAFWVGLLLIMLFALRLHWLPVVGASSLRHLILPTITLALPTAAVVARLVRSSLLDVLGADYIRTADAKGLPRRHVIGRHALRNGMIPVVTVLGLHLGHLIGGAFVVETIFGWPGLGRLTVQAIFDRDAPVVLGAALTVAALYLAINLLVDLAHGQLDPQAAQAAV